MLNKEDRSHIESLKKDDFAAFDALFKKYARSLYAFALSITKETYVAEEITQLVFMKVWEKRSKIEEHHSFKSFLFSIAYNETISWLRKEKSEKRKIESFTNSINYSSNETSYTIEFNNISKLANDLIDTLPEKRKHVFKLSREQGLTNKEISEKLNISIKTVENQITSALRTLKEKLGEQEILGVLFFFIMFY